MAGQQPSEGLPDNITVNCSKTQTKLFDLFYSTLCPDPCYQHNGLTKICEEAVFLGLNAIIALQNVQQCPELAVPGCGPATSQFYVKEKCTAVAPH